MMIKKYAICFSLLGAVLFLSSCAQVSVPDARNVNIPNPVTADQRKKAVNERPDSVMYLPLAKDILVPEVVSDGPLPDENVGPFELRSETLAGALQLILADYDISIAFETEEGLSRRITVANLQGKLDRVVRRVCSLANLYCSFEDNILVVKDTQTFTVTLPPIGAEDGDTEFLDNVASGLAAIIGEDAATPIVDPTTRTIVYSATQRTSELASRYFQRIRANTALIVFETYIWEVSLNSGNSTGVDWDQLDTFGKFNASVSLNGGVSADFTNPVSIGLPTTQSIGATPTDIIQFLSQFGAVKTISQPQITVLSGSSAELRVADTNNFVSEISTTIDDGQSTTSVTTDSVDSGFTLGVGSSWDKSTVYANVAIELTNVISIDDFTFSDGGAGGASTTIQLPQTSERELNTQIRVRPGDSILIAGLVRETDNFDSEGPGFMEPILPQSRTAETQNLELVILLRPRVVAYTTKTDQHFIDYVEDKQKGSRQSSFVDASPEAYTSRRQSLLNDSTVSSAPVSAPVNVDVREPIVSAPVPDIQEADGQVPIPLTELPSSPEPEPFLSPSPQSSSSTYVPLYERLGHQQEVSVPRVDEAALPAPVQPSSPVYSSSVYPRTSVEITPVDDVMTSPSVSRSNSVNTAPSPYAGYDYYTPNY